MQWLTHPFLQTNALWIMAAIGAVVGSFLSLITYRLPKGETIFTRRSHCPHCGARIQAIDLIPIISFLLRRGTARCCKANISKRYLLIELAAATGAVLLTYFYGLNPVSLLFTGLYWLALALIITDFESYLLPDKLLIALGILGLVYVQYTGYPPGDVLKTTLIGFGTAASLRYAALVFLKKPGLGMGDVKLFAVCGIWLAMPICFVPFIFYAGILGVILAIFWRLIGKGAVFPFGPAILIALMICVIYPNSMQIFWQLYQ